MDAMDMVGDAEWSVVSPNSCNMVVVYRNEHLGR